MPTQDISPKNNPSLTQVAEYDRRADVLKRRQDAQQKFIKEHMSFLDPNFKPKGTPTPGVLQKWMDMIGKQYVLSDLKPGDEHFGRVFTVHNVFPTQKAGDISTVVYKVCVGFRAMIPMQHEEHLLNQAQTLVPKDLTFLIEVDKFTSHFEPVNAPSPNERPVEEEDGEEARAPLG